MSLETIRVPDIGDYQGVDVIEINVNAGDTVKVEDPLITLETDKATLEVPAPMAGKIIEITINVGDKISEGDAVLSLETQGMDNASPKEEASEPSSDETPDSIVPTTADIEPESKTDQPVEQTASKAQQTESTGALYASPSVRRLARELEIDLQHVPATGEKGRLTKVDLQQYIKSRLSSGSTSGASLGIIDDPIVDFAKFGEVKVEPLSRIKKISGANLYRNWVRIPHVTFFENADITDLEAFRKAKKPVLEKQNIKLTPVPFLVKAVAKALKDFPTMNSSLAADGNNIVMKQYVHVGVAVDTPNGLMVPVIRDADQKGIIDIAQELMIIIGKARKGQLKPTDMQGGCFTISSLGGVGTTGFTPIVNMPEVGILGVSKATMQPVFDEKAGFTPRLMLPLSLSVDHRVIDGAEAGQFVVTVARYLSDLRELVL